jgi:hypothetical protein
VCYLKMCVKCFGCVAEVDSLIFSLCRESAMFSCCVAVCCSDTIIDVFRPYLPAV